VSQPEGKHAFEELLKGKAGQLYVLPAGEHLRVMPAARRHYRGDNSKFNCHALSWRARMGGAAFDYGFTERGRERRHAVIALVLKLGVCRIAFRRGLPAGVIVKGCHVLDVFSIATLGYGGVIAKAFATAVLIIFDGVAGIHFFAESWDRFHGIV
jgi:hypothetical protein